MAQDYEIKVKVTGVDKATQDVDGLTESMDEASSAGSNAFGALNGMLGGLPAKFGGAVRGIKAMVVGMKSLRVAIISTGIGALVVAIGSLIAYFTRTERGSQKLRVIMSGLGAVVDAIADAAVIMGEFIYEAFTNPQKAVDALNDGISGIFGWFESLGNYIKQNFILAIQVFQRKVLDARIAWNEWTGDDAEATALKAELEELNAAIDETISEIVEAGQEVVEPFVNAAEAVGDFIEETVRAAEAAQALEAAMNRLIVQEREHLTVRAETNKTIAENRLLVEDESLSYDERIAALDRAIAAEIAAVDEELRMAKTRARILEEKAALAESDEETLQAVAEAQARVIDIETQSLRTRKRLEGERQTLLVQRQTADDAATNAIIKNEAEVTAALQEEALAREDEQTQERKKTEAHYEELRMKAGDNAELLAQLKEAERIALQEIDDKYDNLALEAQRKADEEATRIREAENAKREKLEETHQKAIASTFGILSTLSKAFEKDTEEGQKKAFKRNKAISIAETLVSTYQAAQKAYASQLAIPTPDAPIRAQIAAGIAVASGLAKVAAIKSQQFSGGGGAGTATGGGGAIGDTQSVGVDVGSLIPTQQTPTPEPVRAYVVSNEISNKQALDRELQIQTTL
jgi:hypothetical protein